MNLNMKKIFALVLVCFFAMYSVSFAAVGGKRGGFSAPKAPSNSIQQKAPAASQAKPGQNDYKPSKDAKSLDKNAPAANAQSAAKAQPQQGSKMGNMMRNIGLFAGGMFLGSMLGSMFGMGGFMGDMLGLLMNVVIFAAIFMVGRMLWNKYKESKRKKDEDENLYRMRK